jgi:hypothetical protein
MASPLQIKIGGKIFANINDVPSEYFLTPPTILAPVTPADNTVFPGGVARGLNVQSAGFATVLLIDGVTTVQIYLTVGDHWFMVAGVNLTSLGASGITAYY